MEKINEGYCAELFQAEDGKLLKLSRVGWDRAELWQEYENTKQANLLGIPSPRVYDFVEQEGRYGFRMEKVDGITLLQMIQQKPWTAINCAKVMAQLHYAVHSVSSQTTNLRTQKEVYSPGIHQCTELTAEEKRGLIQLLEEIADPAEKSVCHGDFHPMNILLRDGFPVIIDWAFSNCGDPCGDVAGTYLITRLLAVNAAAHNGFERFLFRSFTPMFAEIYLREYCRISGKQRKEILKWLPIRAATYADLGLPPKINERLYQIAKKLNKE